MPDRALLTANEIEGEYDDVVNEETEWEAESDGTVLRKRRSAAQGFARAASSSSRQTAHDF